MNKDQILKIVEFGESQEVELKESFHSSKEFSKIMCRFANTYGNVILLDVNSKKEIVRVRDMKMNNISFGTARLDINEMIKFGYLKKIGSYRGAYYVLKEEGR